LWKERTKDGKPEVWFALESKRLSNRKGSNTIDVFAADCPAPGLKAPFFRQFFRGLKPPAPSAKTIYYCRQLFRRLKPPAPSAKTICNYRQLFRRLKPPAPSQRRSATIGSSSGG
jgi:hypothetical protein